MRGSNYIQVPFLGINNQLLDDQSRDGLCETIVNLKPKGDRANPYWVPFENIRKLRNSTNDDFSYIHGIQNITNAYWQQRNFIGEYATAIGASLKRLVVLSQSISRKAIDIIEPDTWEVVKSVTLPLDGNFDFTCTRVNEVTVINVTKNGIPFILYYLLDDTFIPQGWPDLPDVTYTTVINTFTEPEILAGNTIGIQRKVDTDQYFMVRWAFRLFDGTYVKHGPFNIIKIPMGLETQFYTVEFTHNGYVEELLTNEPFWQSLISGVSVFCTLAKKTEKESLNDGIWYETGFYPWIDRLPEAKWPTVDDPNILLIDTPVINWATFQSLNVDNFTHHRFCAKVVDTYNSRLLLGGSSLDFALPRVKTNADSGGGGVEGGPYTDYFDFSTGFVTFDQFWYTNAGANVGSGGAWDYINDDRQVQAVFTPKPGREFKSIGIVEVNFETPLLITPDGGAFPLVQYFAVIDSGNIRLNHRLKESTYAGGAFDGQLTGDPYMKIIVQIGDIGQPTDEILEFTVTMPVGLGTPYFAFTNAIVTSPGDATGYYVYHVVTLKTESGSFTRIKRQALASAALSVTLEQRIWYPDRRATNYKLIIEDEGTFELALDKNLTAHPNNNYAYVMLSTGEQTYVLGSSILPTTEPDLSLNLIQQWIKNRGQASLTNQPFLFEAAATFRVGNRENDMILGFGVNLDKTSEGQFGQYPLYVFSDKGVWALEQISDPTVSFGKISPVTNFNGLSNTYSLVNAGKVIVASDTKYIYSLAGYEAVRIDEAIANDVNYPNFLQNVHIGYHRANDYEELVFSNPAFQYTLYYNMTYGFWYKSDEVFKFFFYDYPELLGININNEMKDFASLDTTTIKNWRLLSRKMIFGQPYQLKKIHFSFVRASLKQPVAPNPDDYAPVTAKLFGFKDNENIRYPLHQLEYKSEKVKDIRFYSRWGSLHSFVVDIAGTNSNLGSYINELDINLEGRYLHRRRMDCIGDFFYTQPDNEISLCGDANNVQTRYVETFPSPVSSVIVNHNLNGFGPVFCTDLDGYIIIPTILYQDENTVRIWLDPAIAFRVFVYVSENNYIHNQAVASDIVTITHGLGKRPVVTVVDSEGYVIDTTVEFSNLNEVIISLDVPKTFTAYFN